MATRKVISENAIKNNGATVLLGGAHDSTNQVTNAPDATITGHRSGQYGATVPAPASGRPTHKPLTSGTFAFVMDEGKYIIKGVTTTLSGVAKSVTQGSDYGRRSIHKIEHMRRLDEDSWDYVTGAVTKGGSAGAKSDYHDIAAGSGETPNDDAANPSRSVPGELTFMEGGVLPVNKDYEAKTGG